MTGRRERPRRDEGSVLLLVLGWGAVGLLALAVGVDVSAALLQRQSLQATADGAALAGAQGIDMAAYYATGASEATVLDPAAVRGAVRRHLLLAIPPGDPVSVERLDSDGTTVLVVLARPLRLPFLGDLVDGDVRVEARARLSLREPG